ncbi:hypothetical protein [Xenorhabdus bovienii]|uniref:hypothetical protein n=1 Tax=Xenorhabdus bovienii TaxID=40576 RepID=UPI000AAB2F97|nr:hypothetical protein [Xenorhabdus bovienii]
MTLNSISDVITPKIPNTRLSEAYSGRIIATRKARLMQFRENWQNICNPHFERALRLKRIVEEIQKTTKALIIAGSQTRDEKLRQCNTFMHRRMTAGQTCCINSLGRCWQHCRA